MEYLTEDIAHVTPLGKAPAGRRAGMSADQEKLASRIERLIRRRTNDKVRTTAGTPAWVFQSASRWNSGASSSEVTIT